MWRKTETAHDQTDTTSSMKHSADKLIDISLRHMEKCVNLDCNPYDLSKK